MYFKISKTLEICPLINILVFIYLFIVMKKNSTMRPSIQTKVPKRGGSHIKIFKYHIIKNNK